MIDKRLVGLVTCEVLCRLGYAKAFAEEITATVAIITGELAPIDDSAIDRLIQFLSSADRMFERVDDSTGRLLDVRRDTASALPDLFGGSTTMLGSSDAIRKAVLWKR